MGTFFSVILFIILGFYLLGAILRLVLRVWLSRKAKEFEKSGGFSNFGGGFQGFRSQQTRSDYKETNHEGEIKVQKTEQEQKRVSEKVGEYVDFDEVK